MHLLEHLRERWRARGRVSVEAPVCSLGEVEGGAEEEQAGPSRRGVLGTAAAVVGQAIRSVLGAPAQQARF